MTESSALTTTLISGTVVPSLGSVSPAGCPPRPERGLVIVVGPLEAGHMAGDRSRPARRQGTGRKTPSAGPGGQARRSSPIDRYWGGGRDRCDHRVRQKRDSESDAK